MESRNRQEEAARTREAKDRAEDEGRVETDQATRVEANAVEAARVSR